MDYSEYLKRISALYAKAANKKDPISYLEGFFDGSINNITLLKALQEIRDISIKISTSNDQYSQLVEINSTMKNIAIETLEQFEKKIKENP